MNNTQSSRRNLTEDQFWELIEQAKQNLDRVEGLKEALIPLTRSQIRAFLRIFREQRNRANCRELVDLAISLHGGISDDSFIDFRNGLISEGKEAFEQALENPDSLNEMGIFVNIMEEYGYAPYYAYEEKTGKDLW